MVAPDDVLFGASSESQSQSLVPAVTGLDIEEEICTIALGKFGDESISFFGDVNAEEDTCATLAIIACGS